MARYRETGRSPFTARIRGLRADTSRTSHAEEASALDIGHPTEDAALRGRLRHLDVMGGGCGTDPRPIDRIARARRGP